MADERLDQILSRLREQGGRVTTPRRAIIAALLAGDHHVTAEALAEAVQRAEPEIHRATVYRTLDTLTELGVINHVHLGHGAAVYHLADNAHHHLVCDACGAVVELPADVFDALGRRIEHDYGFRLNAHHFALGGLCARCTADKGTASPAGQMHDRQ
jgi:Fur family transcriptional regulator, ferric uptake regulator